MKFNLAVAITVLILQVSSALEVGSIFSFTENNYDMQGLRDFMEAMGLSFPSDVSTSGSFQVAGSKGGKGYKDSKSGVSRFKSGSGSRSKGSKGDDDSGSSGSKSGSSSGSVSVSGSRSKVSKGDDDSGSSGSKSGSSSDSGSGSKGSKGDDDDYYPAPPQPLQTLSPVCPPEPPSPTPEPPTPPTAAPIAPTVAPIASPTEAPVVPPTEAPVVPPTAEAPVIPPTEAPVVPPTEAPDIPPTEAPVIPPTDAPIIPPTEAPTEECDVKVEIGCFSNGDTVDSTSCDALASPNTICEERPEWMQFKFYGGNCNQSTNIQEEGKFSCSDFGDIPESAPVFIRAFSTNDETIYFEGTISHNGLYNVTDPSGNRLSADMILTIYSSEGGELLQTLQYHSSCSQNLFLKDRFGASQLVAFYNDEQGLVDCFITSKYTFTISN